MTASTGARRRVREESGFSLVIALLVLLVSSSLVAVVLTTAASDLHLTQTDASQKRAYAAALAGIEDYQLHLNREPNYWDKCPSESHHQVPGDPMAHFSYATMGVNGGKCQAGSFSSMIQGGNGVKGDIFRIESTGTVEYAGHTSTRTIVASFHNPTFTEYVYFSNFEVQDPETYLVSKHHPVHCEHYYAERKANNWIGECSPIEFDSADQVKGQMHTNDAAEACGTPTFGRFASDNIEMVGGYYCESGSSSPKFLGTKMIGGATIPLPPSDDELASLADSTFEGRTEISFSGTKMKVTNAALHWTEHETEFPANGVVYVANENGCAEQYTSANPNYEEPECGNVYVKGEYTKALTIAAENDVIIDGNLYTTTEGGAPEAKPTGTAVLGLIANDFVRVYHPVAPDNCVTNKYGQQTCQYVNEYNNCTAPSVNPLKNLVIDAAIMSAKHTFIVDNFRCKANELLGNLTVWGTIIQNWRGPVGTAGSSGYNKNYNYDERLLADQPPDYLTPGTNVWNLYRETSAGG